MICDFCKKEIVKPIIANNGNMYCDQCLSSIFGTQLMESVSLDFGVDTTNKYIKSEQLFNESIAIADKDYERSISLKNQALDLCLQSSIKGNPFAMVNLGFYFENGYFDGDRLDIILNAMRWDVAIAIYEPEVANILGMKPLAIESDKLISISELIGTAIYNLQCLLKNNYNFIENSNLKNLFKMETITVIRLLQNTLVKKGVFVSNENDESANNIDAEELINANAIVASEDPRDIIINLASSSDHMIFDIRNQSGNLIYKELFDMNKLSRKLSKQFFSKYIVVIKTDELSITASSVSDYAEQYKKRLITFNGISTLGVIAKKDKNVKMAFNTIGGKKQAFNVSFNSAKCKDYIINNVDEDMLFGSFTAERVKVLAASMYRNSKVGNSTDYKSEILQKASSFIKLK